VEKRRLILSPLCVISRREITVTCPCDIYNSNPYTGALPVVASVDRQQPVGLALLPLGLQIACQTSTLGASEIFNGGG
jgi:hypothetical protein